MNVLEQQSGSENTALEQTSPNDAICIVWATSEFFSLILLLFVYPKVSKVIYSVNERLTRPRGLWDGDTGANGPKRCDMHRLGYR